MEKLGTVPIGKQAEVANAHETERPGRGASEPGRSAHLHSGEETKGTAPLAGQGRAAKGGVPESAARGRQLRQEPAWNAALRTVTRPRG